MAQLRLNNAGRATKGAAVLQPQSKQLVATYRCSCRRPVVLARAGSSGSSSGDKSPATATAAATSSSSSEADAEEARIEALEAASRKGRSKTSARRQIPIRNMTPKADSSSSSNRAEWKEGQLFPEGWEQMSLAEKITELYLGKRGMLYWSSEVAWKGAIALLVVWVLFRLGGGLGLYELQGDLLTPPPL